MEEVSSSVTETHERVGEDPPATQQGVHGSLPGQLLEELWALAAELKEDLIKEGKRAGRGQDTVTCHWRFSHPQPFCTSDAACEQRLQLSRVQGAQELRQRQHHRCRGHVGR